MLSSPGCCGHCLLSMIFSHSEQSKFRSGPGPWAAPGILVLCGLCSPRLHSELGPVVYKSSLRGVAAATRSLQFHPHPNHFGLRDELSPRSFAALPSAAPSSSICEEAAGGARKELSEEPQDPTGLDSVGPEGIVLCSTYSGPSEWRPGVLH